MTTPLSSTVSRSHPALHALVCIIAVLGFAAATSAGAGAAAKKPVLRILVTNDDGYAAPGIDAAVQALRALPNTSVVVVAPLTNQSGSAGKTTPGTLAVSHVATASNYPAIAVQGYPADTIHWAINQHGVAKRPALVVSGINFGENVGPLADLSGTVGAARAAAADGIPAIAVSQGIDNGDQPNFAQAASLLVRWVNAHRSALVNQTFTARQSVALNVPTCPGSVRGPVNVPLAVTTNNARLDLVNCSSTESKFTNDVEAFINGYAALSPLGHAPKT